MHYQELLTELNSFADENYKKFHSKLLKNENIKLLGVRTPILRELAKKYKNFVDEILLFPDEYYDVTFIKLTIVSLMPYNLFIKYVDQSVDLINNWATCDCFKAKCIKNNKEKFLPYISKYLASEKEFYQRYALVTLLNYYVTEEYLQLIFHSVTNCDTTKYYVYMAAAWLIAEVLIKRFDFGVKILKSGLLDNKTRNKSIHKAVESFRLSPEQKTYLKTLKV